MEESEAMSCSQTDMGLIDHTTGDVNDIFGGDGVGGGCGVGWVSS